MPGGPGPRGCAHVTRRQWPVIRSWSAAQSAARVPSQLAAEALYSGILLRHDLRVRQNCQRLIRCKDRSRHGGRAAGFCQKSEQKSLLTLAGKREVLEALNIECEVRELAPATGAGAAQRQPALRGLAGRRPRDYRMVAQRERHSDCGRGGAAKAAVACRSAPAVRGRVPIEGQGQRRGASQALSCARGVALAAAPVPPPPLGCGFGAAAGGSGGG